MEKFDMIDPNWCMVLLTGAMVVLTCIYVIATFFIWLSGEKSAKAAIAAITEQKRQFDEMQRPFIEVSLQFQRGESAFLVLENTGRRLATNIKVHMHEEFIRQFGAIVGGTTIGCFKNLMATEFSMAAGQHLYMALGNGWDILQYPLAKINVSYENNYGEHYDDTYFIDFQKYNFLTFVKLPLEQIDATLHEVNKTLEDIKSTLHSKK